MGRAHSASSRPTSIALLSVIVPVVALLCTSLPVAGASLQDQIDAARQRASALGKSVQKSEALVAALERDQVATRQALQDTAKQLDGIHADQRKVRHQIDKAKAALARAQKRHDALVDDLRQSDYTLGLLEQELSNGEDDLKARRQALGKRLADAYRTENTSLLEQLLTADSFSDAPTETSAYLAYSDQDAEAIAQIATDQQALDTLRLLVEDHSWERVAESIGV